MTKEVEVWSGGKIILMMKIENCFECPFYKDGSFGEYAESCGIGDEDIVMEMPYGDDPNGGVSPQCRLATVRK